MRFRLLTALPAAFLTATSPAAAIEMSYAITQMYASLEAPPPTASRMTVCYGFGCRLRQHLDFGPGDRRALTELLNKGKANAEAERQALRHAVQWLDRRMGPVIKTTTRVARADFRHRADSTNYDCYDTTRNAVSLLLVLREWGLLRHHTISDPSYRGTWILGQTPHNTAVVRDKVSGQLWVVDLWTRAYGELPDLMPLDRWLNEN